MRVGEHKGEITEEKDKLLALGEARIQEMVGDIIFRYNTEKLQKQYKELPYTQIHHL